MHARFMLRHACMGFVLGLAVSGAAMAQDEAAPPQPPDLRQVQLQVWISETSETGLRDIGVNLDYQRFVRGVEQDGASLERVTTNVFDPRDPDFQVTLPAPDTNPPPDNLRPDQEGNLNDGIQTQEGAGLTFSIIDSGRGTIDGVFRAIERKSDLDLISKPELLVAQGKVATIRAGGEFPYQSVQYNKNVPVLNVAWRDIGVNINVTPTIENNGLVRLAFTELDVTDIVRVDNIRGIDLPVFSTRKQTGHVLVPDGQALVVGGLSSRVVLRSERRVPVIGQLPVIGIPFRGTNAQATNNHLLIFVLPTIVDLREMKPSTVNALNFWRAREWNQTDRIQREVEALEEGL